MITGWCRTVLAWVLLTLFACGAALAEDMYVEQEISIPEMPGRPAQNITSKQWISGKKLRIETSVPGSHVQIMRVDLRKIWLLNAEKKTYRELSLDELKAAGSAKSALFGEVTVKQTGATRKIGEWQCSEVLLTATGGVIPMQIQQWLCKDVKIDPELMKEIQQIGNRAAGAAAKQMANIPGFPIETKVTMIMGGQPIVSTTKTKKITYESVPPEMFEIPEGYTKAAPPAGGCGT